MPFQKRTDEDFRSYRRKCYVNHRHYETPLTRIPDFDIIKNIPRDYLHLICLGINKKLICFWVDKPTKNKAGKLSSRQVRKIDEHISKVSIVFQYLDYHYWKGREHRENLLYWGPVVYKDVLDDKIYKHYMLLHVAITILVSHKNIMYI